MENNIRGSCTLLKNGARLCHLTTRDGREAAIEVARDGSRRVIDSGGIDRDDIDRGISKILGKSRYEEDIVEVPQEGEDDGMGISTLREKACSALL